MDAHRVVRTPLPVDLIREMDEAILGGLGGYGTRTEFITDAIRERLIELKFEEAPEAIGGEPPESEPVRSEIRTLRPPATSPRIETDAISGARGRLEDTEILPVVDGHVVEAEVGVPANEPLFGLHNRDYPSLWGLRLLAEITRDGPVSLADFEVVACQRAWKFSEVLQSLEEAIGQRLAGTFPKNREKKDASEGAFRAFALGNHQEDDDGEIRTRGPLYQWRVAGLVEGDRGLLIGATSAGLELLQAVKGMTAVTPHDRGHAEAFLDHLRCHAPADWWGFERLLAAVHGGAATRSEVIEEFRRGPFDWTENEVSTNAAGYVARGREWGLLAPKQERGRYVLTHFGEAIASSGRGDKR